ncbi:MAG: N-acetyltransferase [Methanomicrobiales archaeon HGW-Methanomicrobiales-1]|jgi:diamine N-acetyltransferase|nr:MAG: N-acetyltransferase [Methanomicrobiales archaeon HGW-Methanomicrobiales-1]
MIALRKFTDEDIPGIKSWPPYPPEFSELDYSLRDGGWLDEYRTKAGTNIFVVTDPSGLAGFSIITKEDTGIAEFRIALHPDNLGKGIGKTATLLTLQQGFSDPDITRIRLIVRKNNPRARKLYETLRFRHTGECISVVNGKNVEFFTMVIDRKTFFTVDKT